MDGVAQMTRAEWSLAAETLRLAADKKDDDGDDAAATAVNNDKDMYQFLLRRFSGPCCMQPSEVFYSRPKNKVSNEIFVEFFLEFWPKSTKSERIREKKWPN